MGNGDKTFYDKKIVYLDYLERGEKIKNGGFAKWEVRGEDCRIQIQIRGLYTTDTLQSEIRLISGEETYQADRIGLRFGTGEYTSRWKRDDLAGSGVSYGECDGILIKLSDTRMLKAQWRKRAGVPGKPGETGNEVEREQNMAEEGASVIPVETAEGGKRKEAPEAVEGGKSKEAPEPIEDGKLKEALEQAEEKEPEKAQKAIEEGKQKEALEQAEEREPERAAEPVKEKEPEKAWEPVEKEKPERTLEAVEERRPAEARLEPTRETGGGEPVWEEPLPEKTEPEKAAGKERAGRVMGEVKTEEFPLSQDKWEQLKRIYPKIHPFGDEREYLSVTPRDFIVLARQYQELVQNSFMLHGYYNYGHLILTKIMDNREERYYLGVPGVYYDREKQAALLFGFEGFEAGTDKMEEGGFGYYMKRVEI